MPKFEGVYVLAQYRKCPNSAAEDKTVVLLKNATGLDFKPASNGFYQLEVPEVESVSVKASVSLRYFPSTGSRLIDLLRQIFGYASRYVLIVSVITDTLDGKRLYQDRAYDFYAAIKVKEQIDKERIKVQGRGELFFQNYTGEPSDLFRDLNWLAAHHVE